ncbi:MAG TPA: DUF4118 domain-containing protein [Methylophilus sp.]|uniref:DUF4118 domain-containing protein n=1 Tax=Methylophilus sp. TaxID=29541 RepID=UPI002BB78129|nr:DUF4118 domain-containing protein [Methylophilus sp.]HSH87316.1 DUF4118 domain-containing protein [Methylophilus sp.]
MTYSSADTRLQKVNMWHKGLALALSPVPGRISLLILVSWLAGVTWLGLAYFSGLGVTVITMLYLLGVLWAAYLLRFSAALLTAITAFLLINYCFIEPRYSLSVGSKQSWVILLVFAIVALTVSSLMQQLKQQMLQSRHAAQQSRFFQSLAELLAAQSSTEALLQAACQHIAEVFPIRARVVRQTEPGALIWLAGPDGTSTAVENVDARQNQSSPLVQATSVEWALDFNRPVGAGTNDWPTLGYCLLPFGFPQREVLVLDAAVTLPDLHFLQLLTHQIAQAYTKLSQQMALAQAELSASEANFKKTLLTALSHDMRTPLTVILGAANVLTDRKIPLTAGQSQQLLQSIQAETTYLSQATENILTLVKLDAGASSLQLDWQSPQDVIQHVVSRYQRRSPPEALQVNVSDEEVLVRMDAVLVAHALANLIDNAICWRSAESAIEVTLSINQDWLQISVLNEGPGFAEGFAISAFAPHTQRPTGTRGFGLGLSIVNTVMQLHQGKLEISSVPDQQTCVQLLFPFVRASELIAS